MSRALVVGYGNTLRGDDGLGPQAVDRLRQLLSGTELCKVEFPAVEFPAVEFLSCFQLAPEHAELIAAFDLVIFIDASVEGRPGEVKVERISADAAQAEASLTHHVSPAALLALASTLYGRAPTAMLVTGTGANFDDGEGLSAEALVALEEICRVVPRLIEEFGQQQ